MDSALKSIFQQKLPVEVFVMDGGSTDNSLDVIRLWEHRLTGWRSHPDQGQAAAINEGIARGSAPYVCWLNSDDFFLPDALKKLVIGLEANKDCSAVYGRAWNLVEKSDKRKPIFVESFNEHRLALRCIISQPATLIRRTIWDKVGGLDTSLQMAMDYDLWWRIWKLGLPLNFIDDYIAVNREHELTKTSTKRSLHYKEAIGVVRKHYGSVPFKWWLLQPYAVWYKIIKNKYFL